MKPKFYLSVRSTLKNVFFGIRYLKPFAIPSLFLGDDENENPINPKKNDNCEVFEFHSNDIGDNFSILSETSEEEEEGSQILSRFPY